MKYDDGSSERPSAKIFFSLIKRNSQEHLLTFYHSVSGCDAQNGGSHPMTRRGTSLRIRELKYGKNSDL